MEHQSSLTSTPRINLSSKLQAFYNLAFKHYPSKKEVERSDDEQEFFTSGGANYLHAIELTTIMALRAANEKQNTAQ